MKNQVQQTCLVVIGLLQAIQAKNQVQTREKIKFGKLEKKSSSANLSSQGRKFKIQVQINRGYFLFCRRPSAIVKKENWESYVPYVYILNLE